MSIDRWRDKKVVVHIYNGILFSYKLLPFVTTWMGLEGIMLKWNVRQRKTNVVSMISFLFYFIFKLYIIVLVFAKYQNESATGIHVFHFAIVCAVCGLCHHFIFSSTENRSFFWQMDGCNFGSVCAVFKDCFSLWN